MGEYNTCGAEIAVHERRCSSCGASVRRAGSPVGPDFLSDAPTDEELSPARLCHLPALPGMVILAWYLFRLLVVWVVDSAGFKYRPPGRVRFGPAQVVIRMESPSRGAQLPTSCGRQ